MDGSNPPASSSSGASGPNEASDGPAGPSQPLPVPASQNNRNISLASLFERIQERHASDDNMSVDDDENIDVVGEMGRLVEYESDSDEETMLLRAIELSRQVIDQQVSKKLSITITLNETNVGITKEEVLRQLCQVCGNRGDYICRGCYQSIYCGPDHQNEHWSEHGKSCAYLGLLRYPALIYARNVSLVKIDEFDKSFKRMSPYNVQLKASVPGGTPLLEEKPFLICPWPRTVGLARTGTSGSTGPGLLIRNLSCFGCGKFLPFSFTQCEKCSLVLCSKNCLFLANHDNGECKIIQEQLTKPDGKGKRVDLRELCISPKKREMLYTDVMMIRLLVKFDELRKSQSQDDFINEWVRLNTLWSSKPSKPNLTDVQMETNFRFSFNLLRGNQTLLSKLLSIVELYAVTLQLPFRRFRVICLFTNLVGHSCAPNCQLVLNEPGVHKMDIDQLEENPNHLTVVLKSGKSLNPGTSLTVSYAPLILGTFERRHFLKTEYAFFCECPRCTDPSEKMSYATNVKCHSCHSFLIPSAECVTNPGVGVFGNLEMPVEQQPFWECISSTKRPGGFRKTRVVCGKIKHEEALIKFENFEHSLTKYTTSENISRLRDALMSLRTEDGFFFLSALLKMAEDILRGNFLPLPDVDAENLTEFSDSTLASIVVTKYLYADFMRIILPSFEFEGFPIGSLELAENELMGRELGEVMLRQFIHMRSVRLRQGLLLSHA